MRGLGRRVVALGLALVIAAACSGGDDDGGGASIEPGTSESDAPAADGGRLVVGLPSAPSTLDPTATALSVTDLTYALAVFDPLMAVDEDGAVVPYLAESLQASDDELLWTLVLRDGLTFSDGQPVTADAVVRVLEAHLASELTRTVLRGIESVAVYDRRTVEIQLTRPWATFPSILTGPLGLVPAPSFLDGGPPVGSGPFVVAELVPGSSLRVTRNPTYWRAEEGLPHLDELELRAIPDANDRVAALAAGSVDVITTAEPDGIATLAETDDVGTALVDDGSIPAYTLVFNTATPPFDDVGCRRAVAAAIDREALVDEVGPDVLIVPDGEHKGEVGSCDFTYRTGSSDLDTAVSGVVRDQLDEAGITMTLRQSDTSDALLGALLGEFQAFATQDVDVTDPDARDALLRAGNAAPIGALGRNLGRFDDADVQDALDAARGAPDPSTRAELDAAVDELVADRLPYLTLFRVPWAYGFDPDVGGIRLGLTLPDGGRALPRPGVLLPADLHAIDTR